MNSCFQSKKAPPTSKQIIALKSIDDAGGAIYPSLYKWLYTGWRQGEKLQTLIEFITERKTHLYKSGKGYVSISVRQMQKEHAERGHTRGGNDTWQKYLKAFISWGLLEHHKPQAGEGSIKAERNAIIEARKQAKKFKLTGGYVNPTRWYHLPEYTETLLLEADRKASGYIPSWLKADWIKNTSQEEADRIYGDNRPIGEKRKEAQEAIEATLTACIHNSGYATAEMLIETTQANTGFRKRYVQDTLRGIRRDLIERYDLKHGRPSKEQIRAYDLKGYGYIYTRNEKQA